MVKSTNTYNKEEKNTAIFFNVSLDQNVKTMQVISIIIDQ